MTDDDQHFDVRPLRLPRHPGGAHSEPHSTSRYAYLLDADDDLAEEFDIRARVGARRHATARVLEADAGECDIHGPLETTQGGLGLLILDGLLALEMCVGDRTATELVGAGDLLQPPGAENYELLERQDSWRALYPTRLALLDADFVQRVRPWPQIVQALLVRAGKRVSDLSVVRAITAQPRLEVRLVLLLWHLAARWGRVEPAGIRLTLPLTHRLLGQLVSAERPSISHALHRLSDAGLVTGGAGDLHLHGSLGQHLESLIDRTGAMLQPAAQNGRAAWQAPI